MAVGRAKDALQALYAITSSKRHKVWSKAIEQVMFKYVELCVTTDSSRRAKEGLYQYRGVCATAGNYASLATICARFVELAEAATVAGKAKAEAAAAAAEAAAAGSTIACSSSCTSSTLPVPA